MSSRAQRCFRLFLVLIALPTAAAVKAQDAPTPQPTPQWEVVNPFRFIHDQESVDELRRAYDELKKELKPGDKDGVTAQALERRLQDLSEKEVADGRRKAANCGNPQTAEEKRRCFEPYSGWFARVAEKDEIKGRGYYWKTCWNPGTPGSKTDAPRFRTDTPECSDYIYPTAHRVRVWVENAPAPVTAWFRDGQPLTLDTEPKLKNCDARYHGASCIEFPVPYGVGAPETTVAISARLADGSVTEAVSVKVVDKLVVGLGDSYAAGEGNPDIPARFTQGRDEKDRLPGVFKHDPSAVAKGELRPRKDEGEDAEAHWLDRRCHRSMYSYQFKTALQLALANPRQAITYVSYSCSGATTDEIISKQEGAKEEKGKVEVQLAALREALRNKDGGPMREVDYLLLSTGGNDVRFAKYVIYVLLSGLPLRGYKIIPGGVNEGKLEASKAEDEFRKDLLGDSRKQGNYFKLNQALLNAPSEDTPGGEKADESKRIRIKNCGPGGPCGRILLTVYPNILTDEDGQTCRANREEFTNPFGADSGRGTRIGQLDTFVVQQLRKVQQDRLISDPSMTDPSIADSAIANRLGWTVVSGNADAYLKHGFCAQAKPPKKPADETDLPKRNKDESWKDFDPRDYRPYTSRERWVRIPVDAKLTTDQMHRILKRMSPLLRIGSGVSVDLFFEDDTSIIMHPTAEGLARTADENVKVIKKLEPKANFETAP